jgi:hypothetical protein
MPILSSITSKLPSPVKVITKGAGLLALGMVLSDAHYTGKMQSDLYSSEKDASSTMYYLNNSMYLTSGSKTQEKIKNWSFTTELDQTWKRFFNEGIGYIKGFTSMLGTHILPLALGTGALLGGKKLGKISAGGLGIYAGYQFIKNFFGIGTPQGIKFD